LRSRDPAGLVEVELAAALAVLLVPVLLLVAVLPRWVETRYAAAVAAREAARGAALAYPADGADAAAAAVAEVATRHGIEPGRLRLELDAPARRGGTVVATVTVRVPALAVPGVGPLGAWEVRVTSTRRIDDHRSR
jgi:hypothetical protein